MAISLVLSLETQVSRKLSAEGKRRHLTLPLLPFLSLQQLVLSWVCILHQRAQNRFVVSIAEIFHLQRYVRRGENIMLSDHSFSTKKRSNVGSEEWQSRRRMNVSPIRRNVILGSSTK